MKEFLSGLAMLLLLSVFLIQFTANQITHDKLLFIEKDISTSLQEVKQEGCFTPEITEKLEEQITEDLRQQDISGLGISTTHADTENRAERGELIYYEITVPVTNIVGAAQFLGVDENEMTKTYSGYVASEYISFEDANS